MTGSTEGRFLVRTTWWVTAAFAVTAVGALVVPVERGLAAALAGMMFIAGAGAMLAAVVIAARRAGAAQIGVGALFFLGGAAPRSVQRSLVGAFVLQLIIGMATAAARPYTAAALGVLAPVAGLGTSGLWGARHGVFGPTGGPKTETGARP